MQIKNSQVVPEVNDALTTAEKGFAKTMERAAKALGSSISILKGARDPGNIGYPSSKAKAINLIEKAQDLVLDIADDIDDF